jgi:hypothetical protein
MNLTVLLGANPTPEDLYPKGTFLDPGTKEGLIVLGATCVVALAVMAWAALYVRKRRRHGRHAHGHRGQSVGAEALEAVQSSPGNGEVHHHRRRRKRRRDHRPRNPTLAETGGLPPVRPDDPSRF